MKMTVEYGYIGLDYLAQFKPFSRERIGEASKSEMQRWFEQKAVQVNGKPLAWDEPVFPKDVSSLVLFPKGKRVTLL